ncbi:MAG: hypothetical protein M3020_23825, partial [Myxococcota bacterium]|nr:hypothetical protein [Myxococcota bacterium]
MNRVGLAWVVWLGSVSFARVLFAQGADPPPSVPPLDAPPAPPPAPPSETAPAEGEAAPAPLAPPPPPGGPAPVAEATEESTP